MASSSSAGPPVPQPIRPTHPEDWEPYKEVISQLYTEVKLKDVMREMERNYGFKAT
jgi:Clr5-like protein